MNIGELLFSGIEQDVINIGIFGIKKSDLEYITNQAIRVVVILIMMYLVVKIGNKIIKKLVKKQIESDARLSLDTQKAKTLGSILKSMLRYATYITGVVLIVSDFFSGISVIFASVGGVALGFGAQSLVKDIINGLFILFENQYGVGDNITVGQFSGTVEAIGIRTTLIRDISGDVHSIPNGTIAAVTNHSKGNKSFTVDVFINYEEDVDRAINCIEKVSSEYIKTNEDVLEISTVGIASLNQNYYTIRVSGKVKPLKQWSVESNLRRIIKIQMDNEGIMFPQRSNPI